MALTVNYFAGAELGDLKETDASTGTVTAESTGQRTGGYAYKIASGGSLRFKPYVFGEASAGVGKVVGFAVKFSSLSPSSDLDFWSFETDTANQLVRLRLKTGGNIALVDDVGTEQDTWASPGLSTDTWYYFEAWWEDATSGDAEVFVDGTSRLSATAIDLKDSGADSVTDAFVAANGVDVWIDDYYHLSDATAATDRLGASEIFAYQKTDGGATELGDALDTGTWGNASETPVNETNTAEYTASGALSGGMSTSTGSRAGPNGDADIDGTIQAGKWSYWLKRGGGGSTTHNIRYGNSGDGFATDEVVSLGTGFALFEHVSELAAQVPTSSEYFYIGMSKASGNRDIIAADMWAQVLHTPSAGATTPKTISASGAGAATVTAVPIYVRTISASGVGTVTLTRVATYKRTISAAGTGTAVLARVATYLRTIATSGTGTAVLLAGKLIQQVISAAGVGTAALATVATHVRTIASSATGAASLTRVAFYFRTISAAANGTAVLARVATFFRSISAAGTGVAVVTAAKMILQTIAASAVGTAVLTPLQVIGQTISATATGTASLATVATHLRTISAAALGTAAVSRVATFHRTISAAATGTATFIKKVSLTIAASAVGTAVVNTATIIGQTISSAASGAANLVAVFIAAGPPGAARLWRWIALRLGL